MQTQAPEQTEAGTKSALLMFGKPITPDSFEARAIAAGHTLELDGDGQIDGVALAYGHCNGPRCSVCDWGGCHHCNPPIPPCDGGVEKAERDAAERVEAAAPDLLAALKVARDAIASAPPATFGEGDSGGLSAPYPIQSEILATIDAAISRAEA